MSDTSDDSVRIGRRGFMASVAAAGAAGASSGAFGAPAANPLPATPLRRRLDTSINGRPVQLHCEARSSLLDVLREQQGLTGTKKGCDHGQCGACTVHIDGRRVASCLTLAVKTEGRAITTIEGVESASGALHPMQQAFLDHDALQCGYCTPGQIMAVIACVREGHAGSAAQIREYMSGNLCRCGAYAAILEAIIDGAMRMKESGHA